MNTGNVDYFPEILRCEDPIKTREDAKRTAIKFMLATRYRIKNIYIANCKFVKIESIKISK